MFVLENGAGDVSTASREQSIRLRDAADNAHVTKSQGVLLIRENAVATFGAHKVHLCNHTDSPFTPRVDPAAGSECRGVCQVNVGGRYRQNDIGWLDVFIAKIIDLLLKLRGLVMTSNLDISW